jgi:hypothetical protein
VPEASAPPDRAPVSPADLDAWIAAPAVRTRRARSAAAGPDDLWTAAAGVRLSETRTVGRLVRWRIPGTPADLRFAELFDRYPFVRLDAGPRHFVAGLCGRIWTLRRDYPRLAGPDAFAAWNEPATVRVLFAHWAEPAGHGGARLVSEARVEPLDRRAGVRLRALWAVIGRFEPLIGSEPLALATRRAESARRRPERGHQPARASTGSPTSSPARGDSPR